MTKLSTPFPLLIDADTHLDLIQPHQASILFDLVARNRHYLRTWLPWVDECRCVADSEKFIQQANLYRQKNQALSLGIWHQAKLVGVVSFTYLDEEQGKATIGYWLDERHQGKGIMTKACQVLISFGFSLLHLQYIVISCAVENTPSQKVALRLGFTLEGTVKNKEWLYNRYVDHYIYTMTSANWYSLQHKPDSTTTSQPPSITQGPF